MHRHFLVRGIIPNSIKHLLKAKNINKSTSALSSCDKTSNKTMDKSTDKLIIKAKNKSTDQSIRVKCSVKSEKKKDSEDIMMRASMFFE